MMMKFPSSCTCSHSLQWWSMGESVIVSDSQHIMRHSCWKMVVWNSNCGQDGILFSLRKNEMIVERGYNLVIKNRCQAIKKRCYAILIASSFVFSFGFVFSFVFCDWNHIPQAQAWPWLKLWLSGQKNKVQIELHPSTKPNNSSVFQMLKVYWHILHTNWLNNNMNNNM